MPLQTQPEDRPSAVCFAFRRKEDGLDVTCISLPQQKSHPYLVREAPLHFASDEEFKKKVVQAGLTPAVAEDPGRSFNATARQLMQLGFSVELEDRAA